MWSGGTLARIGSGAYDVVEREWFGGPPNAITDESVGRDRHRAPALPHERLLALLSHKT